MNNYTDDEKSLLFLIDQRTEKIYLDKSIYFKRNIYSLGNKKLSHSS